MKLIRQIALISLFVCLLTDGNAQSTFKELFANKMAGYKISIQANQPIESYAKAELLTFKKAGNAFISYYKIPGKYAASNLLKDYHARAIQQSCISATRDSLYFYDFTFNKEVYLIKFCSIYSDGPDEECYQFKRLFLEFLKKNKAVEIKISD